MKLGDIVVLKENKPEYMKLGIEKEKTIGGVYSENKENGKWNILFLDKEKLIGEFLILEEDLESFQSQDTSKALSYDGEIIPNYTDVELINDNAHYKKQGAFKGMKGIVIEVWDNGGYEVDFSPSIENQIYCSVIGNDLRIVKE